MATGTRQDQFRVTLKVAGNNWGVWEKKSGGKLSGNTTKLFPGGMAPEQSLGGRPSSDLITLSRNYDRARDHDNLQQLVPGVGRYECVVQQQPLDANGNAYGSPVVWNGVLESVQIPDVDASSTSSAEVVLEISVNGAPATS
jgi:hypothetical protein